VQEDPLSEFSPPTRFGAASWADVPESPGVYAIYDRDELVYIGMAGRNGSGSLRRRLKDHSTGQVVNMFAQYLFLARVQFVVAARITHPRQAKAACQAYIRERCQFRYRSLPDGAAARELEVALRRGLRPALNAS
jgi:hypothetical protein